MGKVHRPLPVKFFTGILTSIPELVPALHERLADTLGPIDLSSDSFPFDATDYYDKEMGKPITRHFLSFSDLRPASRLAETKVCTNRIEEEFDARYRQVARPVNLDPGYIEDAKLVLASTKNFYHRILLGDGIYAEVTLHYENGQWQPFPWTYPDFRSGRYDDFLMLLRNTYRAQRRKL
ncbi:MAG: DUF4416 domain-containing protein [Acidobacteria bacterium]|nr:MAG: DUF4416 domain-containing protein [Acidobacteriota bacterium]PYV04489.1 MAG: DUF4416 domain-containing protein [Acidobacteriota bacterium]PYV41454.1 MAG: DUF4416 domain-containing protein [Acidobacteriota bacterium]